MHASRLVRFVVVVGFIGALAFTPVRVRVTADISVDSAAHDAAKAISTEMLDRGGELVTSPSGARWYVVKGISVSLSASDHLVVIEASRMRGTGCSSKSLRRDEEEVFAVLDQFIDEVSRNSGIPMHAVRRKEPNKAVDPTPRSAQGNSGGSSQD